MKSRFNPLVAVVVAVGGCTLGSCGHHVEPTSISVVDSVRHYYPVVSGRTLNVNFVVENTGQEPLVLSEIHPSCGCIIAQEDYSKRVIPPGDQLHLDFLFNTKKNIGYVKHVIRLYGNMAPDGRSELSFDLNIVPPSLYIPDYEEVYEEERGASSSSLFKGQEKGKGYYTDDTNAQDIHDENAKDSRMP